MIGLFDSGYGGLTILKALREHLPHYSYTYYGDNKRAPYGPRSDQEIFDLTLLGVEYLFSKGATLVILACNTASASALRKIQQQVLPKEYPDKKVLGLVVPTIERITGADWNNQAPITTPITNVQINIGVLSTKHTKDTNAFKNEIHKRNKTINVIQQPCEKLAALIEENASPQQLDSDIKQCLSELNEKIELTKLHAVLLGSTHYDLVADLISENLPESVKVIRQPSIIALSLEQYLTKHSDLEEKIKKGGRVSFVTTGDIEEVSKQASHYYGEPVSFTAVE